MKLISLSVRFYLSMTVFQLILFEFGFENDYLNNKNFKKRTSSKLHTESCQGVSIILFSLLKPYHMYVINMYRIVFFSLLIPRFFLEVGIYRILQNYASSRMPIHYKMYTLVIDIFHFWIDFCVWNYCVWTCVFMHVRQANIKHCR